MGTVVQLGGVFVTAFVVGFSGAMMPGPLLAVTITESSRRGAIAGPLLMVGHMLLEGVLVAAIALGLVGFLKNALVIALIGFAGGAMMCWMGQGMLRSVRTVSLKVESGRSTSMHPVVAGVLVSLSNPYWTIWWATIGITYVIMGLRFGTVGLLVFFAGHILSDFAWYTLVSTAMAKGRTIMPDTVYRWLIGACGVALLAFGAWFFWTGFATLTRGTGA